MPANNVRELLVEELKDIFDAEHRLTKALPKLAKAADDESLAAAFEDHLKQTEEHVTRLERVFEILGETAKRKTCKAMVGLLEEGQEIMDEEAPPSIKDLGIIAAAQKVEHYEIATYGCLRAWAERIGESQIVKLLQKTLDEESAADEKLTSVSESLDVDESSEDEGDDHATVAMGSGKARNGAKRSSSRTSSR